MTTLGAAVLGATMALRLAAACRQLRASLAASCRVRRARISGRKSGCASTAVAGAMCAERKATQSGSMQGGYNGKYNGKYVACSFGPVPTFQPQGPYLFRVHRAAGRCPHLRMPVLL